MLSPSSANQAPRRSGLHLNGDREKPSKNQLALCFLSSLPPVSWSNRPALDSAVRLRLHSPLSGHVRTVSLDYREKKLKKAKMCDRALPFSPEPALDWTHPETAGFPKASLLNAGWGRGVVGGGQCRAAQRCRATVILLLFTLSLARAIIPRMGSIYSIAMRCYWSSLHTQPSVQVLMFRGYTHEPNVRLHVQVCAFL